MNSKHNMEFAAAREGLLHFRAGRSRTLVAVLSGEEAEETGTGPISGILNRILDSGGALKSSSLLWSRHHQYRVEDWLTRADRQSICGVGFLWTGAWRWCSRGHHWVTLE